MKNNAQVKAFALDRAIEVLKLKSDGATIDDVLAAAEKICEYTYVEETAEELAILEKAQALEIRENAVGLAEKEDEIKTREMAVNPIQVIPAGVEVI